MGALVLITFCINFLIYIINKDNRFFVGLLVLLAATIALDKYTAINLGEMAGTVFDQVVETPVLFGAFLIPAFLSYGMVYLFKTRPLYGCRVETKKTQVRGGEFAFLNVFGEDTLFKERSTNDYSKRSPKTNCCYVFSVLILWAGVFPTRNLS